MSDWNDRVVLITPLFSCISDEHFAKMVTLTISQLKLRCCSILSENFASEPSAFILVDTN